MPSFPGRTRPPGSGSNFRDEPEHDELAALRGNFGFQRWPLGGYGTGQPAEPLLSFEESPSTFWILGGVSGRGWIHPRTARLCQLHHGCRSGTLRRPSRGFGNGTDVFRSGLYRSQRSRPARCDPALCQQYARFLHHGRTRLRRWGKQRQIRSTPLLH